MRLSGLIITGLALWIATATAIDAQFRETPELSRDLLLTLQARRVLHNDPELTHWNIGVSVQRRVATLFGPAPSAEVIFRAELCLRTMVGLSEIRNELFVSEFLSPREPPAKPIAPPLQPPELAPPMLPRDHRSIFSKPDVRLGHELKPTKQPTPAHKTSQPKMPAPTALEPELADAVRKLLSGHAAYKNVEFDVRERRVYLSVREDSMDALLEAARAVARLPGVDSVVLLDKPR